MAETKTPNFGWTKPDIGGNSSTWGNVLNTTFDAINSVAYANQQSGVPIGSIVMYAGSSPPAGWLWCLGQVYADTDIPNLVPILNHAFPGSDGSHTALPNLGGRAPVGYNGGGWAMGAMAGEVNHTLLYYEVPSHNHSAYQDAHNHYNWQDAHVHAAWQNGHTHSVYQDAHVHGDAGHSHGVSASASQDAHTHTYQGVGGGAAGIGFGSNYGSVGQTTSGASANAVYVSVSIGTGYANIDARQPAIHIDTQTPAVAVDARQPGVYSDNRQPAVYTGAAGNDYTHNNMQPYTVVGFIIRYY